MGKRALLQSKTFAQKLKQYEDTGAPGKIYNGSGPEASRARRKKKSPGDRPTRPCYYSMYERKRGTRRRRRNTELYTGVRAARLSAACRSRAWFRNLPGAIDCPIISASFVRGRRAAVDRLNANSRRRARPETKAAGRFSRAGCCSCVLLRSVITRARLISSFGSGISWVCGSGFLRRDGLACIVDPE